MRHSIRAGLAFSAILLAGCQSIDGPAAPSAISGAALEEPYVATDQPERLGREHFARGHYALAERYFQNAVETRPQDGDSWIGLAASYDQLGRFDLADRAYDQAARIKGQTPQVLNNRGYSYLLRGDTARADAMFQRARQLNPGSQTINNNITIARQVPK